MSPLIGDATATTTRRLLHSCQSQAGHRPDSREVRVDAQTYPAPKLPQGGARTVPVRSAWAGRDALEKSDVVGPDNSLRTGTVRGPMRRGVPAGLNRYENRSHYFKSLRDLREK